MLRYRQFEGRAATPGPLQGQRAENRSEARNAAAPAAGRQKGQIDMLTKDQEREVLKKIAELIESTGKNSYISVAFAGCVKDAVANIEDDAAYSWMDRAVTTEKKLEAALQKVETLSDRANNLDTLRVEQNRRACEAEKRADELQAELNQRNDIIRQLNGKSLDQHDRLEQQAAEIIKLKARIYDLLTKEEN